MAATVTGTTPPPSPPPPPPTLAAAGAVDVEMGPAGCFAFVRRHRRRRASARPAASSPGPLPRTDGGASSSTSARGRFWKRLSYQALPEPAAATAAQALPSPPPTPQPERAPASPPLSRAHTPDTHPAPTSTLPDAVPPRAHAPSQAAADRLLQPGATIGGYLVCDKIGEGSFGNVRLGRSLATGRTVALKLVTLPPPGSPRQTVALRAPVRPARARLPLAPLDTSAPAAPTNEVDVLRALDGAPGVVGLLDLLDVPNGMVLVMEYCAGGDLFEAVRHGPLYDEELARHRFRQMVQALREVHERGICHRDLKLENFFLDADGNVKLGDFGLARQITAAPAAASPAQSVRSTASSLGPWSTMSSSVASSVASAASSVLLHTFCGSVDYGSPEVLAGRPYNGFLSDLWSLGVCLFAMVSGCFPFEGPAAVFEGHLAFPQGMSADLVDLIARLLVTEPAKRLSLEGILAHRWLQQPSRAR